MSKEDLRKAAKKAIEEERKQQEWKRGLDRDLQKARKADRAAQKALLGAFVAPAAILGTTIAQEKREREREREKRRRTGKKKHSIIGTILKFFLFLFLASILQAAVSRL